MIEYFEIGFDDAATMRDRTPPAANDPYIPEEYLRHVAKSWARLVEHFNYNAELGGATEYLALDIQPQSVALVRGDGQLIVRVEPDDKAHHIDLVVGHGANQSSCQFRTAYGGGLENVRAAYMGAIRQALAPSDTSLYGAMAPADRRLAHLFCDF